MYLKITNLCLALFFTLNACAQAAQPRHPQTYTNGIGMEFVLIPAGSFLMGSAEEVLEPLKENRSDAAKKFLDAEMPQHSVTISKPFYLGKYEVTQAQWVAVLGDNPSKFAGKDHPVEQVSWEDAQNFIRRLNQKTGTDKYRLPTEAEWEYAARASTATPYFNDEAQLAQYAWYGEKHNTGTTHPVGQKKPNAWGLYDMYGNVWEWVQDWYSEDYYASSLPVDPRGPESGSGRVNRGGGWNTFALYFRSAYRYFDSPGSRDHALGFRLALSLE
jgi:formylglycine-generating enzyme required for sulfatase activity